MDIMKLDKVIHIDPSMYELFPPPLGENYILQQIDAAKADHYEMSKGHRQVREHMSPELARTIPLIDPTLHTAANGVPFFLSTVLVEDEGKAPYLKTTASSAGGMMLDFVAQWLKRDDF